MYDNSPNTAHIIRSTLEEEYSGWKLVQAIPIITTIAGVVSPNKTTQALFGKSGIGKTTPQLMALEILERNKFNVYRIHKGGFTVAGLAQLFDGTQNPVKTNKVRLLQESEVIYLEDLSDTTDYMRNATISLITSMSEAVDIDYTVKDAVCKIDLKKFKTGIFGGTDNHYSQLLRSDVWNDKVRRRVLTLFMYLFHDEYEQKEEETKEMDDPKKTIDMGKTLLERRGYDKIKINKPPKDVTMNLTSELKAVRNRAYDILNKTIKDSGSSMYIIQSIAKGHAIMNNRTEVIKEDFNIFIDFLERFILPFNAVDFPLFTYILEEEKFPIQRVAKNIANVSPAKLRFNIEISPLLEFRLLPVETGQPAYHVCPTKTTAEVYTRWKKTLKKITENM